GVLARGRGVPRRRGGAADARLGGVAGTRERDRLLLRDHARSRGCGSGGLVAGRTRGVAGRALGHLLRAGGTGARARAARIRRGRGLRRRAGRRAILRRAPRPAPAGGAGGPDAGGDEGRRGGAPPAPPFLFPPPPPPPP